jgi:hypothetical protein
MQTKNKTKQQHPELNKMILGNQQKHLLKYQEKKSTQLSNQIGILLIVLQNLFFNICRFCIVWLKVHGSTRLFSKFFNGGLDNIGFGRTHGGGC